MILEALRRQAALNSLLFDERVKALLIGPDDNLAQALLVNGFTQKEVGEMLGLTQSAVSRRQRRARAPESEVLEETAHD